MSSTYSTNLALELIGTGDQAGTWGNTTNTNLGTLLEQAISGYVTQGVTAGADTTITIPNGSSGVARNMYIELTGTGGASTNLIVPANKKLYFIFNNSTGAVTVKVSGQTGVSVPTGKKMVLVSNGTDIVNGINYIADFASNSATITHLSATSATITNLTLTSLVISNLSIASANITTLTSASATITNLLSTSLAVSSIATFAAGSAAAPSITTTGDTNTGIFFPAADTIAFTDGGLESMRIDSSNRILLGLSSALQGDTLEVAARSSGGAISLFGRASDNGSQLSFRSNGSATQKAALYGSDVGLEVITGTTIRATIDSSGNLGLGVSPSAWNTAGRAIEVGKLGNAVYSTAANTRYDTSNAFLNSSGDFKYSANGNATVYTQFNGTHAWNTAASGTAGNTISFTQAMTLTTGGNLLVGTTTDSTARRVRVYGSEASAASTSLILQNSSSGTGNTDGFSLELDGTSAYLWNYENAEIRIGTNNTERARITAGGDFLVGTTSNLGTAGKGQFVQPGSGSAGAAISADATNATFAYSIAWFAANRSASADFNFINCTSDQYNTAQFRVQGNGTIFATNTTVQAISDVRTKENIRDATEGLKVILGLQPRRFDFKQGFGNGRKNVLGFVAQEIETVFSDAVSEAYLDHDKKDILYKTVGPGELIPVLVKAIQEQQAIITQLTARITALEGT